MLTVLWRRLLQGRKKLWVWRFAQRGIVHVANDTDHGQERSCTAAELHAPSDGVRRTEDGLGRGLVDDYDRRRP